MTVSHSAAPRCLQRGGLGERRLADTVSDTRGIFVPFSCSCCTKGSITERVGHKID